jgi:hypothetical protein
MAASIVRQEFRPFPSAAMSELRLLTLNEAADHPPRLWKTLCTEPGSRFLQAA